MFIKLTDPSNNKVRVNTNYLIAYGPPDNDPDNEEMNIKCTAIVSNETLYILETPEQIDQLLTESHIYIKEIK